MELGGSKIFQIWCEWKIPGLDIWNFVNIKDEEFIKDQLNWVLNHLFKTNTKIWTNTKINKQIAVAHIKVTWLVKFAYVHTWNNSRLEK